MVAVASDPACRQAQYLNQCRPRFVQVYSDEAKRVPGQQGIHASAAARRFFRATIDRGRDPICSRFDPLPNRRVATSADNVYGAAPKFAPQPDSRPELHGDAAKSNVMSILPWDCFTILCGNGRSRKTFLGEHGGGGGGHPTARTGNADTTSGVDNGALWQVLRRAYIPVT